MSQAKKFLKDEIGTNEFLEQESPEAENPSEKGPDFFLTKPNRNWKEVVKNWEEDNAKGLVRENVEHFGKPDIVEKDQVTWNNVNDPVEKTLWDQAIVRDMADPHLDHVDSLIATKHVDWQSGQREAIHRVEGVIATPGTYVAIVCGDWNGMNSILNWVQKAAAGNLPEKYKK